MVLPDTGIRGSSFTLLPREALGLNLLEDLSHHLMAHELLVWDTDGADVEPAMCAGGGGGEHEKAKFPWEHRARLSINLCPL